MTIFNRHGHYSRTPDMLHTPSKDQYRILARLQSDVYGHVSGGSFNMMAAWNKGSNWGFGSNDLYRKANKTHKHYPETCGVHAELNLHLNCSMKGGTIYTAGFIHTSGSPMANTRPCKYCCEILDGCGVRWAVYYSNGVPVKAMMRELV